MNQQRHIIKKQIIDLQLSSQKGAVELQSEVSRIYHSKVVPLIEDFCDRLSNSQEVMRIDALEIDLGNIDINKGACHFFEKKTGSSWRFKYAQR